MIIVNVTETNFITQLKLRVVNLKQFVQMESQQQIVASTTKIHEEQFQKTEQSKKQRENTLPINQNQVIQNLGQNQRFDQDLNQQFKKEQNQQQKRVFSIGQATFEFNIQEDIYEGIKKHSQASVSLSNHHLKIESSNWVILYKKDAIILDRMIKSGCSNILTSDMHQGGFQAKLIRKLPQINFYRLKSLTIDLSISNIEFMSYLNANQLRWLELQKCAISSYKSAQKTIFPKLNELTIINKGSCQFDQLSRIKFHDDNPLKFHIENNSNQNRYQTNPWLYLWFKFSNPSISDLETFINYVEEYHKSQLIVDEVQNQISRGFRRQEQRIQRFMELWQIRDPGQNLLNQTIILNFKKIHKIQKKTIIFHNL